MKSLIFILLPFVLACKTSVPKPTLPEHVTISTTNGIRHIHNNDIPISTIQLEVDLILGETDIKDQYFSGFPSIYEHPNGNIYIIDSRVCNIKKFANDGTFLKTIGRRGQGPGEFIMGPIDMAFFQDGRILISDGNNKRYQWFDKNDNFLQTIIPEDHRPWKFVTTQSGRIITKKSPFHMPKGSEDTKQFLQYDLKFNALQHFGYYPAYDDPHMAMFLNQNAMAMNSNDDITVCYTMRNLVEFYRCDTLYQTMDRNMAFKSQKAEMKQRTVDGKSTSFSIETDHFSAAMDIDKLDNLYVLTYTRPITDVRKNKKLDYIILEIFDSNGFLTHRIPIPEIRPGGIKIGHDNSIYIEDWDTFNVIRYKPVIQLLNSKGTV